MNLMNTTFRVVRMIQPKKKQVTMIKQTGGRALLQTTWTLWLALDKDDRMDGQFDKFEWGWIHLTEVKWHRDNENGRQWIGWSAVPCVCLPNKFWHFLQHNDPCQYRHPAEACALYAGHWYDHPACTLRPQNIFDCDDGGVNLWLTIVKQVLPTINSVCRQFSSSVTKIQFYRLNE